MCSHCGSTLKPPTAELLALAAEVDAKLAALRAELAQAEDRQRVQEALLAAWLPAAAARKTYLHKLSLLSRYVQDGAWVGGPVSSEVDTTNYDVMLNNELRKQREAAQIEERIKLESVQRAQAEKELARLVVPHAVTDLDSLSKHAALRSSQARTLAEAAQSAADGLRAKQAAARDLETQYKVQMATYQAGQAQLAELTRTVSEMDTNNALIKKLRQARPVLAAKLWAGLLAAISRTFSDLRGVPSVVGRSADGFEVDGKPALAVTDIAVTVREFVQPLEGGGMDSEVNRVIRNRSDHFARIAVIDSVFVCDNLIVRLDFADDAHISLNTLL
jgi:DNA repair exonuclease SbcCD ATPase subunit